MKTAEFTQRLQTAHVNLWDTCARIPQELHHASNEGKWSALQHVQHIGKGLGAYCAYLKADKKLLEQNFGLCDQVPKSFLEIRNMVYTSLENGAVSTPRFNPDLNLEATLLSEQEKGKSLLNELAITLASWNELALDSYICPHPNLGNLSAREMFYFTIIHAEHHAKSIASIKDMLAK